MADQSFSVADAIERLDKSYDLVYVDYRDSLSDGQVAAIVRGDWESFDDSFADWESDARWESVQYVIKETFTDDEWDALSPDDQDAVRETIEDRDTSNFVAQLVRQTPDPLLRINVVDEDNAWSFEQVTADEVLAQVGLDATADNVAAVDYALANASPEFSVLLGYWIVSVDLGALYAAMDAKTVTIRNPYLYLGNPFSGSGFITEDALTGTVTVPRDELRTDRDAFGYSVDEIYGGLNASGFAADIEIEEG